MAPSLRRLWLGSLAATLVFAASSEAGVTRLDITRREVVLNGQSFGAAGPYEKLSGTVHFALEPRAPGNTAIVDLPLAPRNARGLVEFTADFYLLKPVDPNRGNGRLFYEAGNRGTKRILPVFQGGTGSDDPHTAAEFGNGALMEQGFTLLWMGWQWDVPAGRMRMAMPIATDAGRAITGLVRGNFIPGANATTASIADRGHEAYPVVDPASAAHVMYVRTLPADRPTVVPRDRWRFSGPGTVTLDGGFTAGRIYDVVYQARDPRVVGVGLAGTRDLISFFKHATAAAGNPSPGLRHAIGWGVSQTGRFLRHFVYEGFNQDEQGRIVFDGVFDQVGGAGRGSFNHRFAQQSRDQLQHYNIQYPVDMFPFTDEDQTDPVTGLTDGLLARARRTNTVPKFFHLLTNSEYFNRAGSLVHTDVTGTHDVAPPDTSRIYMVASAPHIVGAFPPAPFADQDFLGRADMNPLVYTPVIRALFRALDRWVVDGTAPPPSRYPTHRRRHLDHARRGRLAGRARCGPAPGADDDLSPGLRARVGHRSRQQRAARSGRAVCEPRAGGRRRRQWPGRHPPSADCRAAGDAHRLELSPSVDRRRRSPGQRDRRLLAAAAHPRRARAQRRWPAIDCRALRQPRGLPGPHRAGGRGPGARPLSPARGRAGHPQPGGRALRLGHPLTALPATPPPAGAFRVGAATGDHSMNPMSAVGKLASVGNVAASSPGVAPNHLPSVAPNCEVLILGIHAPRLPESSGPPRLSSGCWP